ncbi:hypothetical protein D1Z97_04100 [Riemerella anatipestifer]|uniref:HTTM domain-containing protein n=1 Tax=Riemerella anatipestifer TaxID=34085 RepID=UPI00129D81C7|nr:HTTM domain-containing protein [Riemerella anatipestifer]MBT0550954.1 HTTM domain-containing protein [Riemerella anatipestifer]MBT0553107.1 HTTM domain-containing protein [Riemerella anatipestifer]MCE3023799.1 HTTM domain-containing protein [Riemerella anatipestifer]MCU7559550.1 HTTM domain-containing protein [Riemerella anatipestifer]MDY3448730.1 HTTM domain-containing protein [Riemerella anatipestifer]
MNYLKTYFSPSFLFFFRISIGLVVLLHFLSIWSDFSSLYTRKSVIPLELHTIYNFYDILSIENILSYLERFYSKESSVLIFKYSYVVFCLLIVIGLFSRVSALILLFLQVSFIKHGNLFFYGADFFTEISLFYIFLFPTSSFYSVQSILFPKLSGTKQSVTLCKRLIQVHLCFVYFFSGLDKILGFNWWNGEAVWKAINLPNLTHYIKISDYITSPLFYIAVGWGTILVELLYPIFINFEKTRKFWLFLTISMHVGIIISFNLFFFSSIMIIWNLTAYYFNYYDYEKFDFKNIIVSSIRTLLFLWTIL